MKVKTKNIYMNLLNSKNVLVYYLNDHDVLYGDDDLFLMKRKQQQKLYFERITYLVRSQSSLWFSGQQQQQHPNNKHAYIIEQNQIH